MLTLPSYVLITPARNEAESIELTIKSVVLQTVRPIKWIIVSDGSTDGTDEIVRKYAADHPWIELLRMPERRERHFAGKVQAFNAGYARVQGLDYEWLAASMPMFPLIRITFPTCFASWRKTALWA